MATARVREKAIHQRDRKRRAAETARPTQADERAVPRKPAVTVQEREAAIDAALEMSFPASDPPPWTP